MRRLLFVLLPLSLAAPLAAQNSTEKLRPEPSALAASVGSGVPWEEDLDSAMAKAAAEDKPIFCYVPTIAGSFMDRKPELDLYLRGGPFSWPRLIAMLEQETIPLRLPVGKDVNRRFKLKPIAFIEPGFLMLRVERGNAKEVWRLDRVDTFHPAFLEARLREALGKPAADPAVNPYPTLLVDGDAWYRSSQDAAKQDEALADLSKTQGKEAAAEALWLAGAGAWDRQQEARASTLWQRLRDRYPLHPLAAKAALELEGLGPYVNGFESYARLPPALLAAGPAGSQMAKGAQPEAEARARAVRFLLRMQRADGSWRDSRYDFGGTDSMPNVYMAVTALATRALHLQLPHLPAELQAPVQAAIHRAEAYLQDDAQRNLADSDELVWAELYRLRYWLTVAAGEDEEAVVIARREASKRVADLLGMQGEGGAWAHEYPNPFVTAVVLIALKHAQTAGLAPRGLMASVERGLAALERSRAKDGAYSYGQGNGQVRTPLIASVGRSPVGELARWLWAVDHEGTVHATLDSAFSNEDELFRARKYDDHTNMHIYGGFFFWFALEGRAEAIAALKDKAIRQRQAQRLRAEILALPECDGAFIDSHELGRSYGTAMALLSLAALDAAAAD